MSLVTMWLEKHGKSFRDLPGYSYSQPSKLEQGHNQSRRSEDSNVEKDKKKKKWMEHQPITTISASAYMGKAMTSAMGLQWLREWRLQKWF